MTTWTSNFTTFTGLYYIHKPKHHAYQNVRDYQKQSALALLSYAVVALLLYQMDWGIKAELTILFAFMFFFIFSAVNHAIDAVTRRNFKWANINRPFLTFFLIAGFAYPVYHALLKTG